MAATTTTPPPEARLVAKFDDGISAIKYLPPAAGAELLGGSMAAGGDDDDRQQQRQRRLLVSTSWDGLVRIHDTSTATSSTSSSSSSSSNALLAHNMEQGPILSLAVIPSAPSSSSSSSTMLVTGGLDGSIKVLDIASSTVCLVGKHSAGSTTKGDDETEIIRPAVSCVASLGSNGATTTATTTSATLVNDPNLIVSASWSKQLSIWDLRLSSSSSSSSLSSGPSPVATATLPGKAFSMDVDPTSGRILVATSGRHNCFYDVRKGGGTTTTSPYGSDKTTSTTDDADIELESVLERESSLKFQTRCVRFFPPGQQQQQQQQHSSLAASDSFCIASIEGRVGVEYLDELGSMGGGSGSGSRKKYAFKCHRINDTVYPVNVLACHPKFTTVFATGGCDGTVVLWDAQLKKKLTSLPKFLTSISALDFSYHNNNDGGGHDGTELAIASSYTYEEGDREHPQDELYVRQILDSECEPTKK